MQPLEHDLERSKTPTLLLLVPCIGSLGGTWCALSWLGQCLVLTKESLVHFLGLARCFEGCNYREVMRGMCWIAADCNRSSRASMCWMQIVSLLLLGGCTAWTCIVRPWQLSAAVSLGFGALLCFVELAVLENHTIRRCTAADSCSAGGGLASRARRSPKQDDDYIVTIVSAEARYHTQTEEVPIS